MPDPPITAVREVLEAIDETSTDSGRRDVPTMQTDGPGSMESPQLSETRRRLVSKDLSAMNPDELVGEVSAGLKEMMKALEEDRKAVTLEGKDAKKRMVELMAEDDGTSLEVAEQKLFGNGQDARAFTAEKTGVIYFLDCPERDHDMVHESVHVMSAPGGTTKIKAEFGDPLNEGFTEMFTIEICKKLGVPLAPAYKDEVEFVTRLGTAVTLPMLHAAYMQNAGMDAILSTLARRWLGRSEAFGKKFSTKKFVPVGEEAELKRMLAERMAGGAFKDGLPKQFWTALLAAE